MQDSVVVVVVVGDGGGGGGVVGGGVAVSVVAFGVVVQCSMKLTFWNS